MASDRRCSSDGELRPGGVGAALPSLPELVHERRVPSPPASVGRAVATPVDVVAREAVVSRGTRGRGHPRVRVYGPGSRASSLASQTKR